MKYLIILSTIITIALIIFLWKKKPLEEQENFKYGKIIAVLLFTLLVAILLFKLGEVPYGLHVDEAGLAYDTISLVKSGVDRYLYHNPVYFINFGGGQSSLYTYLATIVIRLCGFSITNIRIPAVVLSLLSALLFSLSIKKEKGQIPALISLFLFLILPFSIMHSRWALDCYLLFPMLIISCFFLQLSFEKKKWYLFFITGISFGITLYTYAMSYLILPIFLAILFLYAIFTKQIKISELFAFGIPLFILAVPLLLMIAVNNGLIDEIRLNWLSIPKLWNYRGNEFSLSHIPENIKNILFLFGQDGLVYNAFENYGTLYYMSIPLVIYGAFIIIKKTWKDRKNKSISLDKIMSSLFIASLICVLVTAGPNINRANAIYVSLLYFLVTGIWTLYQKGKWSIGVLFLLYIIQFVPFTHHYFVEYPKNIQDNYFFVSFDKFEAALDFAKEQTNEEIYIIDDWYNQPYIYTLIADEYDVYAFYKERFSAWGNANRLGRYRFTLEEISPEKVYIFLKEYREPRQFAKQNYKIKKFGKITVYYPYD